MTCPNEDNSRFFDVSNIIYNIKRIFFLGDNEPLNIPNIFEPSIAKSEILKIQNDRLNNAFFSVIATAKDIINNERFSENVKKPVTEELMSRLSKYLLELDKRELIDLIKSYNHTYKSDIGFSEIFDNNNNLLIPDTHDFIHYVVAKYSRAII